MIRSVVAVSLFLALVWGAGCGFNESPHKCKKSSECPAARLCIFSISDGCSGVGHCEDNPNCRPVSMAAFQGCGCDGMPVFDLTANDTMTFPANTRARGNVCGWDGPIQALTPCR